MTTRPRSRPSNAPRQSPAQHDARNVRACPIGSYENPRAGENARSALVQCAVCARRLCAAGKKNFRIHAGAFPAGEAPDPIPNSSPFTPITPVTLPADAFAALCRAPILVVFGDGIAAAPDKANWPADGWRARVEMARLFVDCVNRHGGDATLLLLPERGLRGNTHVPFADTNSEAVADQIAAWLRDKGLD